MGEYHSDISTTNKMAQPVGKLGLYLLSVLYTIAVSIPGDIYVIVPFNKLQNVCDEPKGDSGPCEAEGRRWTFDKISRKCEMFSYGGCKGNGNNFNTKAECEKKCDALSDQDVCDEPKAQDSGSCEAHMTAWTFDKISRKCELFSYGGCGGNGNNFDTKAECEKKCDALSDQGGSCTDDNGITYKHGDWMPAGDDCNSCQCFNGQKTYCTLRGCNPFTGASCIVNGKTYKHGEGMPSKDGCNSCICNNGEEGRCTEADCFDLTDKQEGDSCGFDGGSDPINYGECAEGLTCVNDRPQSIYPGVCREKDCVCKDIFRPVCGHNGKTYDNECSAECAATKVKCDGKCPCSSGAPCKEGGKTYPDGARVPSGDCNSCGCAN